MKYFPKHNEEELEVPSSGWLEGFKQRNNLVNKPEESLEGDRHMNGTTGTVRDYFKLLFKEFPSIKG